MFPTTSGSNLERKERKGDANLFLALPKKRRLERRKVCVPFFPSTSIPPFKHFDLSLVEELKAEKIRRQ
jgi:hypothetical protein